MHFLIRVHIRHKIGCTARKVAFFIISQDRQNQVLAADALATTIII